MEDLMPTPLRVLVVEDSEDDAQLLLRELSRDGFELIARRVDTPEAMLAALENGTWDVVIADYVMPRFSGLEALALLKERGIDLPFITVSGKIGEEAAAEAMRAGAHDYVSKDNLTRLATAIRRELHKAAVRREFRRAQEELRRAHEELETRVMERTAELAQANEQLRLEIAERERLASRWRLLLESLDEGVYGADIQGRCTFLNRSAAKMLGYEPEELVGRNIHQTIHYRHEDGSEYPQEQCPMFLALQRGQGSRVADELLWRRDGTCFPVELSSHPIIEGGVIAGAVVTFVDITTRKQEQEERERLLAETEVERARLAAVLEQMPSGVVIAEAPSGRLIMGNAQVERIWRHPFLASAKIGEYEAYKGFHADGRPYRPEDWPLARSVSAGEVVQDEEIDFLRGDGSHGTMSVSSAPIRDREGRIIAAVVTFHDITERKKAIQEYQTILETTMDGFWTTDMQGRFLDVNEGYCRLTGYTREELLGMRIQDVEAMETPEETARHIQRVKEKGFDRFETRHRRKDGGILDFEVNVTYLAGYGGRLFVFLRDITERKRMEQEREQAFRQIDAERELFRTLVENAPAGIAVIGGADMSYQLVNSAYQAIAPDKPMLGRPWTEVWAEVAPEVQQLVDRVLATGEPFRTIDAPFRIRRGPHAPPEDAYFTFAYIRIQLPLDGSNALLVVNHDTTEQVLSRQRIEELAALAQRQAAELQGVLDNMVDAVYVCDTEGNITLANDAALRLVGMSSLAELSRYPLAEHPTLYQIRHPDGSPVAAAEMPLTRALRGETVVSQELTFRHPGTERDTYVRISAAPIKDEQGKIVRAVAVSRDVTELSELDRLKDQFIAVAAHELKTPVTIMKGYAQALLRTGERTTEQRHKMLEAIDRGSARIDAVVQDLLDISKLATGRLELTIAPIDLSELASLCVDHEALTAERHRIRLASLQPVSIQGDRDRLEQVLMNLLDNAVKYSPRGGDIEVAVNVSDGEAVVSVRDQGVGIPKEKQSRIFQRFYSAHTRTQHDFGGMGVGLHICSEIVVRHGGRMWFESEEGKGSTFYFSLPLPR
ncbi:MAG: PAS domain S-box protein [Chloroflexota bacterium]|nr:MAG: PAS domain S-box protein [Chloroflexota bacterium]